MWTFLLTFYKYFYNILYTVNEKKTNIFLFFPITKSFWLVCRKTVSLPNEYNVRQHFESKHQIYAKLNLHEFFYKNQFSEKSKVFKVTNTENSILTRISFEISREITAVGKLFTERDFIQNCMLIAVCGLCSEKKEIFQNVSLSCMMIQRKVVDIAVNLTGKLTLGERELCVYSLAMDESTDFQDTV